MDTWTCLLLCDPATKPRTISPSHENARSLSEREFSGTAGERHLENIGIMRRVGYSKFYDSCTELSQEEILLRQKVYNLYSGPGNPLNNPWLPVPFFGHGVTDEIASIGLRGLKLMVSVLGSERVSHPRREIIIVSIVPFPFTLVCSLWGVRLM